MNRDEVTQEILAVKRLCKGFLSDEARTIVTNFLRVGDETKARLVDRANRGHTRLVVDIVYRRGRQGDEPYMVFDDDGTAVRYRLGPGCGFDLNPLILAGPLDGEEHPYTCPQCKQVSYITPAKAD